MHFQDLDHDIKDELKGDFENLVLSLMMKPHEFDAYRLHKAMAGIGTTESVWNFSIYFAQVTFYSLLRGILASKFLPDKQR